MPIEARPAPVPVAWAVPGTQPVTPAHEAASSTDSRSAGSRATAS